jgi:hypothetical protein
MPGFEPEPPSAVHEISIVHYERHHYPHDQQLAYKTSILAHPSFSSIPCTHFYHHFVHEVSINDINILINTQLLDLNKRDLQDVGR